MIVPQTNSPIVTYWCTQCTYMFICQFCHYLRQEVMFSSEFVLACFLWTDFDEISRICPKWDKEQVIRFWECDPDHCLDP